MDSTQGVVTTITGLHSSHRQKISREMDVSWDMWSNGKPFQEALRVFILSIFTIQLSSPPSPKEPTPAAFRLKPWAAACPDSGTVDSVS